MGIHKPSLGESRFAIRALNLCIGEGFPNDRRKMALALCLSYIWGSEGSISDPDAPISIPKIMVCQDV